MPVPAALEADALPKVTKTVQGRPSQTRAS